MKRYVFHLYSLLLEDEFISDIKSFRKKWYSSLKEKEIYQKLKEFDLAPPVDFNNPDIEYIHPNMIIKDYFVVPPKFWEEAAEKDGLQKYSDYVEETGEYKGICGYQANNKEEYLEIYINKNNTSQELYSEFIDLLNKYNFPFALRNLNKNLLLNKDKFGKIKTEDLIKQHPLYYFLSSLCVFKIDYFLGPEIKKQNSDLKISEDIIFNPKDFLLYTMNFEYYNLIHAINLFIQFQYEKTLELLNDNKYSKAGILEEIKSKKLFEMFKKEYGDELDNMPNLYLTTGIIQSKKEWEMIYHNLKITKNIDIGKKASLNKLRESYIMYLNRNMTKKDYLNLGLDYERSASTAQRRVEKINNLNFKNDN
ncbi:MAG: hypothetical protein ACOCV1_07860 [Bacillota bacterium]